MLACIGDLVEDVVVRVADPLRVASDTDARIRRRRGGSAANVAATAARLGHRVRFLGQVGAEPIGAALVSDLAGEGVDTSFVRRRGRTGTIVVFVDATGERTMLTDRGASSDLADPTPSWLDGVAALHVPMYSLAIEPMATTVRTLVGWAHERGIAVSLDVSSVALIDAVGADAFTASLLELAPAAVLANADEAAALAIEGPVGRAITVVKRGAAPAIVHDPVGRHEVPADLVAAVDDTTGAGDAFAGGFLTANWQADPVSACRAGHRVAAAFLEARPG